MKSAFLVAISAFILVGHPHPALSEVRLASPFTDHMVVQQGQAIPIWGWADPGEEITVTLGPQTAKTVTEPSGKWNVKLGALPYGDPLVLKVHGKNTVERKDVLVGEVWLCSGQSNMRFPMGPSKDFETEKKAADLPKIRMFTVPLVENQIYDKPLSEVPGKWVICAPNSVADFSAVAFYFGRRLHHELGVPIGLINASWGGTQIQEWTPWEVQESNPEFAPILDKYQKRIASWNPEKANADYEKRLSDWEAASQKARTEGKPFTLSKPNLPIDPNMRRPGRLYNAIISPLLPYSIRGVIWYQGESDTNANFYQVQLKTLIQSWRKSWNQGDFPFLFVQLPNRGAVQEQPVEENMNGVRDAFLQSLTIPNTGMAVTIDGLEPDQLHPLEKRPVGYRLAQWALAKTYGKPLIPSGPLFKSMRTEGGKVIVEFEHVGSGLMTRGNEKLKGFAIKGSDQKWMWADAAIEGDTVVVTHSEIKEPIAVRYSWAVNPIGNLYNKEDLPASPFRTDSTPPPRQ